MKRVSAIGTLVLAICLLPEVTLPTPSSVIFFDQYLSLDSEGGERVIVGRLLIR